MLATLCLQANNSVTNKRFKFHYVLILLVWGFSVCLFVWGFFSVFFLFVCFYEKQYMGQYMYLSCAEFCRQLKCFNNSCLSSDTSRTGIKILSENLNTQAPFYYSINERRTESVLCAAERIAPNGLNL